MPGVPSGRGCESCRKVKKKCSQEKPSCSRCARLCLICTGSGEQKYQFKGPQFIRRAKSHTKIKVEKLPDVYLACIPANRLTLLIGSFVQTFSTTADLKYNLVWCYGLYLQDIPQRLGNNEALDAAVSALVAAHSSLASGLVPSMSAISKYSRALQTLRESLNDPVKAAASETLCAVKLLMICQSFIGCNQNSISHYTGAAQILKARRYYNHKDSFEANLLLSLRGPVLFMGVFSDKIHFTPKEWKMIVENELDGSTPEGRMMCCLAHLPNIMERGKEMLENGHTDPELLEEARSNYREMIAVLEEFLTRKVEMEKQIAMNEVKVAYGHIMDAHFQRVYAIGLSVSIILNCVLAAIDIEDTSLQVQAEHFAKETIALSEGALKFRPLGSSHMFISLMVAWGATNDQSKRSLIEEQLEQYCKDFPYGKAESILKTMDGYIRHLRLAD